MCPLCSLHSAVDDAYCTVGSWRYGKTSCQVVFIVATFTDIESVIAVLYVLVLLRAAIALSQQGILPVGAGCALLAVLSFFCRSGRIWTCHRSCAAAVR